MVPVPERERVAVGLPIDDDGDPTTPERLDPRHPYPLTENALRDELGVPAGNSTATRAALSDAARGTASSREIRPIASGALV